MSDDQLSEVATLGKWAEQHLRGLLIWAGEQNGGNAFAEQVKFWAAARLGDLDAFGDAHREKHP